MELNSILSSGIAAGASDIHLKAGLPPMFRVHGVLRPLSNAPRLAAKAIGEMALELLSGPQRAVFQRQLDVNLSHSVAGVGRFRINIFQQRGIMGLCARIVPDQIESFVGLGLPKVLEQIANEMRGLVLVTGATGSGKSTTLAAIVEFINRHRGGHIVTIEDPIEFVFTDRRCMINQREIGADTPSFAQGLRSCLRQDPDVILIGEMRDEETIEAALRAAETGHLVLSSLHTVNASETVHRIVHAFPADQRQAIRRLFVGVLRAVISQRLVPRSDGQGRLPATEILRVTKRVHDLLGDPERARELPDAMAAGATAYGMQTFDQALMALVRASKITYEDALGYCDNPDDFALRFKGVSSADGGRWEGFEGAGQ